MANGNSKKEKKIRGRKLRIKPVKINPGIIKAGALKGGIPVSTRKPRKMPGC